MIEKNKRMRKDNTLPSLIVGGSITDFWIFWLIIENLIKFKLILKGIRHKILLLVSVFHQDKRFKTPFIPPLFSVLEINFHSPYFFHPFPFIRPPPLQLEMGE